MKVCKTDYKEKRNKKGGQKVLLYWETVGKKKEEECPETSARL